MNSIRVSLSRKHFAEDTVFVGAQGTTTLGKAMFRHFDIIGDVALIHKCQKDCKSDEDETCSWQKSLKSNRKIRVVALRLQS